MDNREEVVGLRLDHVVYGMYVRVKSYQQPAAHSPEGILVQA